MGAWGAGNFENDDAGDWIWSLEDAADTIVLEEAFARIIEPDDCLDACDCSIALAAAEVVAALRKQPGAELPEEVTEFVSRVKISPSPTLVASARSALERIKTKSELQELWDASEDREDWYQSLSDLEARLQR
jgi:Domain of unknown function (DUF4259)